jgi:hypothetical protein|tara:strand:- start:3876 stop:4265 length:390 start_codon:yes stop_codon:yes gene_type:complete
MSQENNNQCGLTFDWDNLTLEDEEVIQALNYLVDEFGTESVWVRVSSSGTGLHILIGKLILDEFTGFPTLSPIPMGVEEQMQYRLADKLECRGRRISDSYRKKVGMRTSRIFQNKNGNPTGEWKKWPKD